MKNLTIAILLLLAGSTQAQTYFFAGGTHGRAKAVTTYKDYGLGYSFGVSHVTAVGPVGFWMSAEYETLGYFQDPLGTPGETITERTRVDLEGLYVKTGLMIRIMDQNSQQAYLTGGYGFSGFFGEVPEVHDETLFNAFAQLHFEFNEKLLVGLSSRWSASKDHYAVQKIFVGYSF